MLNSLTLVMQSDKPEYDLTTGKPINNTNGLMNKNSKQKSKKSHRTTSFQNTGPISSEKNTNLEYNKSYDWKISLFRRLTNAKSTFIIGSPTFSCPIGPDQLSEWYLSLNYSPNGFGSFKVGIFMKNFKGCGSNEIRAHISLFIMKTRGGIGIALGSVKRNFRVEDPSVIFRQYNNNKLGERHCCEKNSNSNCHEWFDAINLQKLTKIQDTILSDGVLRLRAVIKVLAGEKIYMENKSEVPPFNMLTYIPEKLPDPIRYWDKRPNADYVLMCDDTDFKVHKSVIGACSPIFASMIGETWSMSGDNHRTQQDNMIHTHAMMIRDIESPIMAIILDYMYSGTFGNFGPIHLNYDVAMKILKAAGEFRLYSVKNYCFQQMCNGLSLYNAGQYAILAQDFKADPEVKIIINGFLRRNWIVLQQCTKFRELFKTKPEVFEFVFSGITN